MDYTATTTNDTDKITATATDPEAVILIEVNEEELENEGSAEWVEGDNAVVITVTNGEEETVYTVTVTKE